jgi:hypothetical protein
VTPDQRELARHALGLGSGQRRSYRNRFHTSASHPQWVAMVEAGEAQVEHSQPHSVFSLTRQGAEAALEPGESLCPEDFPPPTGDQGS